MARLSKRQIAAHNQAVALLGQDCLSDDDREFVLSNWQESANHVNSAAGAFFTPLGLALDAALFLGDAETIVDLCAGIGGLGLSAWWRSNGRARVTCVEVNPDYVAVGRKLFPEATWICASVADLPAMGQFDAAISNPPFGHTAKIVGPLYSGEDDLAVVDIAAGIADFGVFILPSNSCPFKYSGRASYTKRHSARFARFHSLTGINLSCEPIDCAYHADAWRGVKPKVEVASADFSDLRRDLVGQRIAA